MAKYARRHYEDIAAIINSHLKATELEKLEISKGKIEVLSSLYVNFANLFQQDNQNFDRERFLKACGF